MSRTTKTRFRLLVVDPSVVCREGIAAILARNDRFEIRHSSSERESEAKLAKEHNPDVLLIDPFRDGIDGVWLIKGLADSFPRMQIIVISQRPEEVYAERIL